MEPNKKGLKQHGGSDGILHVTVVVCVALVVFGGFLAGLLLLRGRIVRSEEMVQRLSRICRKEEAMNPGKIKQLLLCSQLALLNLLWVDWQLFSRYLKMDHCTLYARGFAHLNHVFHRACGPLTITT